jgi:hypothetical protein
VVNNRRGVSGETALRQKRQDAMLFMVPITRRMTVEVMMPQGNGGDQDGEKKDNSSDRLHNEGIIPCLSSVRRILIWLMPRAA